MGKHVLDWRNRNAWLRAIPKYASDVLTNEVRELIERDRPDCWSDVMDWLPDHDDLVPEFEEQLWGYYTHAKAFHGCRPGSVASYFEHGIKGQDADSIISRFREIFFDVPANLLQRAIDKMESRRSAERGRIWLSGDDQEMLKEHGHYIIHGSEYLLALAANIDDHREDYRLRLRKIGIPTIFEVDIPVSIIPSSQRNAVAKMILSEWGQLKARKHLGMSSSPCYVVRADISPCSIKVHYHPSEIVDHHGYRGVYRNDLLVCSYCGQ